MKKILLTITLVITMVVSANAQDSFFKSGDASYEGGSRDWGSAMPALPQGSVGTINADQSAPIGSGLLILSVLGGAYALLKKEN